MNSVKSHFYNCFALYLKPGKYFSEIEAGAGLNPVLVLFVFFVNNALRSFGMEKPEHGPGFFITVIIITLLEYFLFYRLLNTLAVFLGGESNYKKLLWFVYSIQLPMAVVNSLSAFLIGMSVGSGMVLIVLMRTFFYVWEMFLFLYCFSRIYKFSAGRAILLGAMIPLLMVLVSGVVFGIVFVVLQFF
ncbi:MAG: hypothetical protein GXO69_04930 [Acidobacteria bacterium]|nr:hypothetical protein [Acidobacteriota bacterium]